MIAPCIKLWDDRVEMFGPCFSSRRSAKDPVEASDRSAQARPSSCSARCHYRHVSAGSEARGSRSGVRQCASAPGLDQVAAAAEKFERAGIRRFPSIYIEGFVWCTTRVERGFS